VLRFFCRHAQPVAVVGGGHAGKAPDGVKGKVDSL
jgi:hypothetical protein